MTTFHQSSGGAIVCDDGSSACYYDGVRSPDGRPPATFTQRRETHMPRHPFATQRRRRHALDESEQEALLGHIKRAYTHANVNGANGRGEIDKGYLRRALEAALEALGDDAEDERDIDNDVGLGVPPDHAKVGGGDRKRAGDRLPRDLSAPLDVGSLFGAENVGGRGR